MERHEALQLLHRYVKNESLRRHMYAVEAAMRDYALRLNDDPEEWGLAGLLHDFDWEIHPSLDKHPQDGAPILRQHGVPENIVRGILSHADHTGVPRKTQMDCALHACDEITGLITAVALVRPSKSILDVQMRSIRKKWKASHFAANVDREEIAAAAEELGIDLWEHVQNVLESMQTIASDLGLAGQTQ